MIAHFLKLEYRKMKKIGKKYVSMFGCYDRVTVVAVFM